MSDLSNQSSPYDQAFFDTLRRGSQQSAQVIVPFLLDWIQPKSVIDVGCGDGTWLSIFQSFGVETIQGIDGDYVDQHNLQIPIECFTTVDLKHPLSESRAFDLVVCLEVAEHLPSTCADQLVQSLSQLGHVIFFSAAIPYQGGTEHINEQWPTYWIRRFEELDYLAVDALRPLIWDNPNVEPWYAQNCLFFVKRDRLSNYPKLKEVSSNFPHNLIHPKIYLQQFSEQYYSRDIEIIDVLFLPCPEVKTGGKLSISINYRCHRSISAAIFSISISNTEGVICVDTHSDEISLPSVNPQFIHSIKLTIKRLDLTQGQYFINVGAYSPDWTIFYDFLWQKYSFFIINPENRQGIIHTPVQWQA